MTSAMSQRDRVMRTHAVFSHHVRGANMQLPISVIHSEGCGGFKPSEICAFRPAILPRSDPRKSRRSGDPTATAGEAVG